MKTKTKMTIAFLAPLFIQGCAPVVTCNYKALDMCMGFTDSVDLDDAEATCENGDGDFNKVKPCSTDGVLGTCQDVRFEMDSGDKVDAEIIIYKGTLIRTDGAAELVCDTQDGTWVTAK